MASNFKIKTIASIDSAAAGTTLLNSADVSAKQTLILQIDIANTYGSTVEGIDLWLEDGSSNKFYLLKDASIPAGNTLAYVRGQKVVFDPANYTLKAKKGSASYSINVTVSFLINI